MSMRRLYGILLLFYTQILPATEYMYPVASLDNGATIILIHQQSPQHIELLQWNTQTNTIEPILWSLFNPAGFQLLPDKSGFSFIDNGRLRIKMFNKRSPKAIDFDLPISTINSLYWIDSCACYCSAQQGDDRAIFQLGDDGTMHSIALCCGKDCMYPQKVNDHLFYIERDKSDTSGNISYHIMHTQYPRSTYNGFDNTYTGDTYQNAALGAKMIVDFKNSPIIFLTMQSEKEGFVIEHQKTIDTNDKTMFFIYHHIINNGDTWSKKELFSFTIASSLLMQGNEESLYESILPLLPRIIDDKIYFVSCALSDNYRLEPYYYDVSTDKCNKVVLQQKIKGHCFVPMLCGNKFYCGGTKQSTKQPLISFLT
jgi:hypothetical protein